MSTKDTIDTKDVSTYNIGLSLGFDDGKGSSGIDDTTFYIIIIIIIICIIICICSISSILVMVSRGDSKTGLDNISEIANQSKLPISLNIITNPQYDPK